MNEIKLIINPAHIFIYSDFQFVLSQGIELTTLLLFMLKFKKELQDRERKGRRKDRILCVIELCR